MKKNIAKQFCEKLLKLIDTFSECKHKTCIISILILIVKGTIAMVTATKNK